MIYVRLVPQKMDKTGHRSRPDSFKIKFIDYASVEVHAIGQFGTGNIVLAIPFDIRIGGFKYHIAPSVEDGHLY